MEQENSVPNPVKGGARAGRVGKSVFAMAGRWESSSHLKYALNIVVDKYQFILQLSKNSMGLNAKVKFKTCQSRNSYRFIGFDTFHYIREPPCSLASSLRWSRKMEVWRIMRLGNTFPKIPTCNVAASWLTASLHRVLQVTSTQHCFSVSEVQASKGAWTWSLVLGDCKDWGNAKGGSWGQWKASSRRNFRVPYTPMPLSVVPLF